MKEKGKREEYEEECQWNLRKMKEKRRRGEHG